MGIGPTAEFYPHELLPKPIQCIIAYSKISLALDIDKVPKGTILQFLRNPRCSYIQQLTARARHNRDNRYSCLFISLLESHGIICWSIIEVLDRDRWCKKEYLFYLNMDRAQFQTSLLEGNILKATNTLDSP